MVNKKQNFIIFNHGKIMKNITSYYLKNNLNRIFDLKKNFKNNKVSKN